MNIYKDVQSLQRSPVETGGLCSIACFKIEDVLTWPTIDPVTSIITNSIQMQVGKTIYLCEAADKGRSFNESSKSDNAGPYVDHRVTAMLSGGHNTANILSLDAMKHHKWGLIIKDRAGFYRLIGNKDAGADFNFTYDSADGSASRKALVQWDWKYPNSAPIYMSQTFTVVIGGVSITTGKLTLIVRFRVGDPGAPMDENDTILTNVGFANKSMLVLADGTALPVDDGSGVIDWAPLITRHIEKVLAGDTITFVGGVTDQEIIEVYAFE